jgi:NAD-dependent deacetylase
MRSEQNESLVRPITGDLHWGDLAEDGAQLRPHIVWFEEPVPLIEIAAAMVQQADILVVVGTSLVVYPAAGLLDFAEASIPKFILDRKVPTTSGIRQLTAIEQPATEGITVLKSLLNNLR